MWMQNRQVHDGVEVEALMCHLLLAQRELDGVPPLQAAVELGAVRQRALYLNEGVSSSHACHHRA